MNWKHKTRPRGTTRELHLPGDDDLEELPEPDDLTEPITHHFPRPNGWPHQCPRCEEITLVVGEYPYCSECNWDSLTDVCGGYPAWAA